MNRTERNLLCFLATSQCPVPADRLCRAIGITRITLRQRLWSLRPQISERLTITRRRLPGGARYDYGVCIETKGPERPRPPQIDRRRALRIAEDDGRLLARLTPTGGMLG